MEKFTINKALNEIEKGVVAALHYDCPPRAKLEEMLPLIDRITGEEKNRAWCQQHFREAGEDNVLLYLSSILYSLKTKADMELTPDILRWMGSVWKNFINRNLSYQSFLPLCDKYSPIMENYFPGGGSFVHQIENVHLVKEDFMDSVEEEEEKYRKVRELEIFYQKAGDILTTMRPTYFFLLDYYNERKIQTGSETEDAVVLKSLGLAGFGYSRYTYQNIAIRTCQALGILEAVYLIMKKKRLNKQIINVDGKKKLLSASEIYDYYRDRFNQLKKELVMLKK